jgi:hypothetical protein
VSAADTTPTNRPSAGDRPMTSRRSSSQRGFTLAEVAVASVIFLFVAIAAFKAFSESNQVYKRGNDQAEMQQRTRLAFDQMMAELRLAGFDYNRDGEENTYPDHPDEQLEWIGPHAIAFRGNLDFDDGSGGREEAYESEPTDPDYGTVCCPIVTTGNDEIVAYALRSNDSSRNTGSLRMFVDLGVPRDAGWDVDGTPAGEEDVVIDNVEMTGNYPPYTLIRFSFNDAGELVERPIATDIRALNFSFLAGDGEPYYCKAVENDGTCASGNQVAFSGVGGLDDQVPGDMLRRSARAGVRRIVAELVGMTERDFRQYRDSDTLMPRRPKLSLEAAVVPQNLGLKGRPDLEDAEGVAPTNVTVCAGQCNTVRIEWDEVDNAAGYNVMLFPPGSNDEFFVGVTPGVAVAGSDPPRVFAVFQRIDSPTLVNGTSIYARVQARFPGDETSDNSIPSAVGVLSDVTRPSAPFDVRATGFDHLDPGWPDVTTNLVVPLTTGTSLDVALPNRIIVSWVAPFWALNVTDPGSPATSWTTAAGAGDPPLACDVQPADMDGDGTNETERTRLHEQFGTVRYLVFRSTNPRFVPTNADFVGAIQGDVDAVAGRVSFTDSTHHVFTNGIFNRTDQAVANCTQYYYRIRAVDDCWDGTNPAGPGNVHVSPFAPPLNPDPTATDSDDTTSMSPSDIGPAIPGFAVPKAAPRKPTGLRFNGYDRRTDDGDGLDATVAFEAVKLDATLAADGTTPAYEDVTITQYQVYSHATSSSFTLSDIKNQTNGVRLDKTITLADLKAGRISRDDENGDGTITAAEDEAVAPYEGTGRLPASGLRVDFADATSRWYKVVAVQCRSEDTVPSGDPASYDFGTPSDAFKFPCDFGGGQFTTITLNTSNFPTSVTSDAIMENPSVGATRARLVVKDRASGDRAVTPSPGKTPSQVVTGTWRITFNSADIAALTDNFGNGNYLISVEWDDVNSCLGVSDSDSQVLSPPSCCMASTVPIISRVTTTQVRNTVSISCSAAALRLMKITVSVDNANGNQQEKFTTVTWDDPDAADDRSFTTNRTSDTFDMTSSPPVLGTGQSGVLTMDFSRNAVGDSVTVTYEYKIGGVTGTCTFTGRIN